MKRLLFRRLRNYVGYCLRALAVSLALQFLVTSTLELILNVNSTNKLRPGLVLGTLTLFGFPLCLVLFSVYQSGKPRPWIHIPVRTLHVCDNRFEIMRSGAYGLKWRTCLVVHKKNVAPSVYTLYEFDFTLSGNIGAGKELMILPKIEGLHLVDSASDVQVLLIDDLFDKKSNENYRTVSRAWLRA